MKPLDMRNMTVDELKAHHDGLIDEMSGLRIKHVLRQLDDPHESTRAAPADRARQDDHSTEADERQVGAKQVQAMMETKTEARPTGRKTFVGVVHSNKMNKTIVVTVERLVKHAQYGKYIKRTTKLYAHDEENKAGIGDKVLVMSTRPMSKTKRWRLIEVLERAK